MRTDNFFNLIASLFNMLRVICFVNYCVKLDGVVVLLYISLYSNSKSILVLHMFIDCNSFIPYFNRNSVHTSKITTLLDLTAMSLRAQQVLQNIFQQWWGPQQSSWNPSKTL